MAPTFVLTFGQISPGLDAGWAEIGHGASPSPKNFFKSEGYRNKTNAKQLSRSILEEVLFLVSFGSQIFDVFLD